VVHAALSGAGETPLRVWRNVRPLGEAGGAPWRSILRRALSARRTADAGFTQYRPIKVVRHQTSIEMTPSANKARRI
jgi:hypothetical protein